MLINSRQIWKTEYLEYFDPPYVALKCYDVMTINMNQLTMIDDAQEILEQMVWILSIGLSISDQDLTNSQSFQANLLLLRQIQWLYTAAGADFQCGSYCIHC